MNVEIHEVCPQFSSEKIEKVKLATTSDQELMMLKMIVHEGWPTSIKEVTQVLKPYWCYRDEISIENGILMKGQRIITPSTLQVEILGKLHAAHQGAEKTKLRARTCVFLAKDELRYRQNNQILSYLPITSTNTSPTTTHPNRDTTSPLAYNCH
jgi:hypothetical protein